MWKDLNRVPRLMICIVLVAVMSSNVSAAVAKSRLTPRKMRSMARVFMTYGDYDKARGLAEKACDQARVEEVESGELALCLIDLGTVYSNLNMLTEAQRILSEGVTLQKQALFETHPYVAHTYRLISDVQRRKGDLVSAEQALSQAIEIMLTHCSLESKEMSPFILESAKLYSAKGQFELAQTNYEIALDRIQQTYGRGHLMTANVLKSMAECSFIQQDYDKADEYITSGLAIESKLFGRSNRMLVDSWLTKARVCRAKGQVDRSEYYLSKVTASVEKNRNAVTLARVYEQVNRIRSEKLYAAAVNLN